MVCLKKSYSKTQLSDWSDRILERLEQTDVFRQARCIAVYYALPGEVQTARWIDRWFGKKTILLPVVQGDDLLLVPYQGRESMKQGAFGIWEPVVSAESDGGGCPIDLLVVPGVAFDRRLNRMGRGRGFYDRLLATAQAPAVGICYDFQLFDEIPVEPFDKPMDGIVTEKEVIGLF